MFGSFAGPVVDKSLNRRPLDEIKDEYDDMMTELDDEIEKASVQMANIETDYKYDHPSFTN